MNTRIKTLIAISAIFSFFVLSGGVALGGQKRTFKATFAEELLLDVDGKPVRTWNAGDVIKLISSEGEEEITLSASMIEGGTCTFTSSLGGDDIVAVYPSSASDGYFGGKIGIKIPALSNGTFAAANICTAKLSGSSLDFYGAVAILKIRMGKGVNRVYFPFSNKYGNYISGKYDINPSESWKSAYAGGGDVITLAPDSPSTEDVYYVAVAPVGIQGGSVYIAKNGKKCVGSERFLQSVAFKRNSIYDLGISEANGKVFTIKASGETVVFSGGNLVFDKGRFFFLDRQYIYDKTRSDTHKTHFYWSGNASEACGQKGTSPVNGTKLFCANGGAIKGWTVLSREEFQFLLNSRSTKNRYMMGKIGTYRVVILFPDTYEQPGNITEVDIDNDSSCKCSQNEITYEDWDFMSKAGAVAIPFNGYVESTDDATIIDRNLRGDYWCNQIRTSDSKIYYQIFRDGRTLLQGPGLGNTAKSIRLVTR